MRLRNPDLAHKLDNSSVFSNISKQANNFLQDEFSLKLGANQTYYVGYYKPFKNLYVEMKQSAIGAEIDVEFWDGTMWSPVPNLLDRSDALKESDFISWQFEDDSKITDSWIPNTIDSRELYWVRLTSAIELVGLSLPSAGLSNTTDTINIDAADIASFALGDVLILNSTKSIVTVTNVDTTLNTVTFEPAELVAVPDGELINKAVQLMGLNLTFANDDDLKTEFPRIFDFLDPALSSFINFHVSARDEIVQRLRIGGESTNASLNGGDFLPGSRILNGKNLRQINKWDFLDIEEIRQAAKYLALAKIFFYVSENNEDKSFTRHANYMSLFGQAFKMFYLSLDSDDDGNQDLVENMEYNDIRIEIL